MLRIAEIFYGIFARTAQTGLKRSPATSRRRSLEAGPANRACVFLPEFVSEDAVSEDELGILTRVYSGYPRPVEFSEAEFHMIFPSERCAK